MPWSGEPHLGCCCFWRGHWWMVMPSSNSSPRSRQLSIYSQKINITIRTRDPSYMTRCLKLLLRRRYRLFRHGQSRAASALADRNQNIITKNNASSFEGLRRWSEKLWTEVRRLRTGCTTNSDQRHNTNINDESFNTHYNKISTDDLYSGPIYHVKLQGRPSNGKMNQKSSALPF